MPDQRVIHHVFDSATGYDPARDLVAVGDPDVHYFDGRWVMHLGAGFATGEGVDLISASLPTGAPLTADVEWKIDLDSRGRVQRLVASPPPAGGFDEWRHTPCVAVGRTPGSPEDVERLYYTGSAGSENFAERGMAIGVMTRSNGHWEPRSQPVIVGDERRPCVLEPKVVYVEGSWHMWFQATHHEAAPGELPDTQIRYTRSVDGLTNWSEPVRVSDHHLFDVVPSILPDGRVHLLSAGAPNMHGPVEGLPRQGLWSSTITRPVGAHALSTGTSAQLLDAETGEGWYRRGTYGPCAVVGPGVDGTDVLHVFFTSRAEPEPEPFRMSVGRMEVPLDELG